MSSKRKEGRKKKVYGAGTWIGVSLRAGKKVEGYATRGGQGRGWAGRRVFWHSCGGAVHTHSGVD